jgi:hypothetical protein
MSTSMIVWRDSIDSPWREMVPASIGDINAGLGTPDKYILLMDNEAPVLRVDAYRSFDECYAFQDAITWLGFLVVGWGDCAFLIDVASRDVAKYALGAYFGHVYAVDESLLVASADRLRCIRREGALKWTSDVLAIDGVVVSDVTDGIVFGEGEWDPPGGWQPFRIRLDSGQAYANGPK